MFICLHVDTNDLAGAFEEMHQKGRYNEILLLVDTCHASSLNDALFSPNIVVRRLSCI